jgi:hypothetical protein
MKFVALAPPFSTQSALGDIAEIEDADGFGADLGEKRVTDRTPRRHSAPELNASR